MDLFVPGVDKVGGFSVWSGPGLLRDKSLLELAVKESGDAQPAKWLHQEAKVGQDVAIRIGHTANAVDPAVHGRRGTCCVVFSSPKFQAEIFIILIRWWRPGRGCTTCCWWPEGSGSTPSCPSCTTCTTSEVGDDEESLQKRHLQPVFPVLQAKRPSRRPTG